MQAWERMPGESEEAFAAFAVYRDLPPGQRSVVEVARQCAKNRSLIGRWSSRHEWLQRVAAYDAFIDQHRVSTQLQAVEEMWRRQTNMALLAQQQALAWLQQIDPAKLPDAVGVRLFTEAARLERLARTAQVDEEVPGSEPTGPLRTLAELFLPAGPGEVQVTELELARIVVEKAGVGRPEAEDLDLDLELEELLATDPEGEADQLDVEEEPERPVVPAPEPAEPSEPSEPEVRPSEPPQLVVEDGQLVQRRRPPPRPDPGWTPGPPPRRASRHNGRR